MKPVRTKKNARLPVVGVLGGICSGKTTVAEVFEREGFLRIDADRIVHSLLGTPEVKENLRRIFGQNIFHSDGSVNRDSLADVVFEDRSMLARLNAILHPGVIEVIERRISEARSPVVLDAALLVETQLDRRFCTHLLFVDTPLQVRRELAGRVRGWGPRELLRRERMQQPLETKREKADLIISNNGSPDELETKVRDAIERISTV